MILGKIYRISVALMVIIGLSPSYAAIERRTTQVEKKDIYIDSGVFSGGQAGTAYTLLAVRRHFSAKDKLERIVFDMGDDKGQPLKAKINYHQVAFDPKRSRVVIDLAQMKSSAVSSDALLNVFKKSPMVRSAKMTFDPTDGGLTVVLDLRRTVEMEVFKLPSQDKSSRLVVDLRLK